VTPTNAARCRLLLAAALAAAAAAGCARSGRGRWAPPSPPGAVPAASRCGFARQGFTTPPFDWTGERAPLVRRGVPGYPMSRLVLDAKDSRGGTTEFLLDTGTSCVLLAHTAPAARDATLGIERLEILANSGSTSFIGRDAVVPAIDLGGLKGTNVPVFVLERSHDLRSPANVLGMVLMTGLALVHEPGDAWSLVRADRLAPASTGVRTVRQEAPGLPVVRLAGPAGEEVFALVDTGTPTSLFAAGSAPGRYRLADTEGQTILDVRALHQAPWGPLRAGGRLITVWIGLDALESRPWTMDFSTGAWTFPVTPAEPTR